MQGVDIDHDCSRHMSGWQQGKSTVADKKWFYNRFGMDSFHKNLRFPVTLIFDNVRFLTTGYTPKFKKLCINQLLSCFCCDDFGVGRKRSDSCQGSDMIIMCMAD